MKNFNIKQYLKNEMTKENCDHLVLVTEGYNEGLPVQIDYECIFCNKKLEGKNQKVPIDDRYVYHRMPNTNKLGENNLIRTIHHLIDVNQEKGEIDLVGMLYQIDPLLHQCNKDGRTPTDNELNTIVNQPKNTYIKK